MEGDAGRCTDLGLGHFRTVARSVAGEVPGFPNLGFSGSPSGPSLGGQIYGFRSFDQSQGQTLGGVRIPQFGIFVQSQGQPKVSRWVFPDSPIWDFWEVPRSIAGEVVSFASRAFFTSPKVHRLVLHFCLRGIFGVVPRSDAGLCILLIQGFA